MTTLENIRVQLSDCINEGKIKILAEGIAKKDDVGEYAVLTNPNHAHGGNISLPLSPKYLAQKNIFRDGRREVECALVEYPTKNRQRIDLVRTH